MLFSNIQRTLKPGRRKKNPINHKKGQKTFFKTYFVIKRELYMANRFFKV